MKHAIVLAALAGAAFAFPAGAADTLSGEVLAHDRVAHVIVLEDKSVVTYNPAKVTVPETLAAGDQVEISFTGGEGERGTILSITIAD